MIKTGFILQIQETGWTGGMNYFKNLLNAISSFPERKIEPVIFTGSRNITQIQQLFPTIPVIYSPLLENGHPFSLIRKGVKKIFGRDYFIERLLKKNQIRVLSHSGCFKTTFGLATIGWIPDFQHKFLPAFFNSSDLNQRDREYEMLVKYCQAVIFSSNTVKSDAIRFYPEYKDKFFVLHFVSDINSEPMSDLHSLKTKYDIPEKFFLLPNQFWIHKNHKIVLEAVKILKSQQKNILVLATGSKEDYRNPDYFKSIEQKIDEFGIGDNFRILGMVPFPDLKGLMIGAIGLLNPSLFEGWITSVEEAKSLGLKIILSDISVHIEQAPEFSRYFDPENPEQLASILWDEWVHYDEQIKKERIENAQKKFPARRKEFAENYEKIVISITNRDRCH